MSLYFKGGLPNGENKTSQQVLDDLALGSFLHISEFEAHGWTVITVADGAPEPTRGVKIRLIDGTGNDPEKIRQCVTWIVEQWKAGQKVFVTCRSAANRAPSLCAAALVISGRWKNMGAAYEWLRSVRPEVGHQSDTFREIEQAIQPLRPPAHRRCRVLFKFRHGLGDAMQFTCVLQHVAKYRPDWDVDVAALIGKHCIFRGLALHHYILGRDEIDEKQYDQVFDPDWWEGGHETKCRKYIREFLRVAPDETLLRYQIHVRPEVKMAAAAYVKTIAGSKPVVLIHYQGNTSADRKDLPHALISGVCQDILAVGAVPVILDWDGRTPIPNGRTIFCPDVSHPLWGATGTGDAETLAALIGESALMLGVDSGPLHVAGATNTPTIGIWTGHLPMQFYDLCPNVTHLVPIGSNCFIKGSRCVEYYSQIGVEEALRYELGGILRAKFQPRPAQQPQKFFVGIPTLSRYDLLEKCLDSVLQSSILPEAIYVVDNGGAWQGHSSPLVRTVTPASNLGVAKSWNLFGRLCHPHPLVIFNDDIEVLPELLADLLSNPADMAVADGAASFCVFVWRPQVRDRIGDFDENFWPAYFEDNDYAWRMRMAGIEIGPSITPGFKTLQHSQTIAAMSESEHAEFKMAWEKSRVYYAKKWGGLPLAERYSRPFNGASPNGLGG